jgi:hypothetical protein
MSQLKVDIILKYINNTISDEFSAVKYTVGIDNEMTKDRDYCQTCIKRSPLGQRKSAL